MDVDWFSAEVAARTRHCDFRPLVTTATDGENGGWFRNTGSNFWSLFYRPLLDRVRTGDAAVQPTFIDDHLDRYGTYGEVTVGPGAWNTGWHDGHGFVQWTGSAAQQETLARTARLSEAVQAALGHATARVGSPDPELVREAQWRLLRAQTSCNFFWGESWLDRCTEDLEEATHLLHAAGRAGS